VIKERRESHVSPSNHKKSNAGIDKKKKKEKKIKIAKGQYLGTL